MFESLPEKSDLDNLNNAINICIAKISNRIEKAVPGSLRINGKQGKYQYYHRINPSDPQGKYIPAKNHTLAVSLAQKDYDIKLLKALENQHKAIENFLNDYDPDAVIKVYEKLSEPRKALVTPEFLSDEKFAKQWQNATYNRLGFKEDDQEFYTAKGERVRSKSEILIADALGRHNIPYHCEYPVYSHGVLMAAPDFKCLNVRLRKEYYWEHLGKLGDKDYADRNAKKLEKYALADDFDEESLILTFETDSHPLNTKVIEAKIRKYLL